MGKVYETVSLPRELTSTARKWLKENPQAGYSSLAELVKDALREKLANLAAAAALKGRRR